MALASVTHFEGGVELVYAFDNEATHRELARLVDAERGCCGAAGVEFELRRVPGRICVIVRTVREGLAAKTVVAAFAAMAANVGRNARGQS